MSVPSADLSHVALPPRLGHMDFAGMAGAAPAGEAGTSGNAAWLARICGGEGLSAIFQPILDFRTGSVSAYEGLVRGPADTPLMSPLALFAAARQAGCAREVEMACRQQVLKTFSRLPLDGKIFLNVSPVDAHGGEPARALRQTLDFLGDIGLSPERVVLELTEHLPTLDLPETRTAMQEYRALGCEIAIDDLGEGYASLRLWSELLPDYVKIDRHFIDGIDADPRKLQFVRSIRQIADACGTRIIAEGIERVAEFHVVRDLGIALGQGYFIARPAAHPQSAPSAIVQAALTAPGAFIHPQPGRMADGNFAVENLASFVEPLSPGMRNDDVYARFEEDAQLEVLPVVENGVPVGLIGRAALIGRFARPFTRELYGKKPCSTIMEQHPLVVDKRTRIEELSRMISDGIVRQVTGGFILTERGRYVGIVQGHELMRQITHMQLDAARYANPLTLLPGNVPIGDYMDHLLGSRTRFCACYFDLDNFKPFNDVFGYRRGDDLIQALSRVLMTVRNPDCDFLGHIGGDDFLILFQSSDWEKRCREALALFDGVVSDFFDRDQVVAGGFEAEDRRGQVIFHPLTSLSIGTVLVEPDQYNSHTEVSAAAAEAKKMAKRQPGNSLFIERRQPRPVVA